MPLDPVGGVVQNLFHLRQLENEVAAQAHELLEDLLDDVAVRIIREDPTGEGGTVRRARLQRIVSEIEELTGETFADYRELMRQEVPPIGVQQSEFASGQLSRALTGVQVAFDPTEGLLSEGQVRTILEENPFRGRTLAEWANRQERAVVTQMRRQIQLGMVQQETTDSIVRRVTEGVLSSRQRRQLEALTRTAINHTATQSHLRTYENNRDVTKTFTWTSVLDARTSAICQGLDGMTWAYDDPDARHPPAHFNCRSILTPNVDWSGLGVEPPETGTRASADGQVPADTTYQDWLRDQDKSTQVEILGEERANLFRANRIGLRDLVTGDNRRRTVDELRALAGMT